MTVQVRPAYIQPRFHSLNADGYRSPPIPPGLFNKMKTTLRPLAWLLALSTGASAWAAQSSEPSMSLEQAVTQVQHETGGKVLSASTVRRGRSSFEHRVKVLTPTGHVRVVTVTTDASKGPASGDPTKNPSSDGGSNKEKH
ncbi:hypothetical protein [Dyella japonica]|uniref:PepSY domain-containing protein n=1 Tax=Dyella japonica TaxID=231455 RepID=A0ABV2JWA4_9GAMM